MPYFLDLFKTCLIIATFSLETVSYESKVNFRNYLPVWLIEFHLHSTNVQKIGHLSQLAFHSRFFTNSFQERLLFNISNKEISRRIRRLLNILNVFIFNKACKLICVYLSKENVDPLKLVHLGFKLCDLMAWILESFIAALRLNFTWLFILRSLTISKWYFLFFFIINIKNFENCFDVFFVYLDFFLFFLFLRNHFRSLCFAFGNIRCFWDVWFYFRFYYWG